MANKWVEHVRAFAKKNKMSYGCAISDPKCKSSYHSEKNVPALETPMRTSRVIKATPPKGEPPKPKPKPKPRVKLLVPRPPPPLPSEVAGAVAVAGADRLPRNWKPKPRPTNKDEIDNLFRGRIQSLFRRPQ